MRPGIPSGGFPISLPERQTANREQNPSRCTMIGWWPRAWCRQPIGPGKNHGARPELLQDGVAKKSPAHQWRLLSPGNSPLIYRRSPVISRVNEIIHEHGATRSDLLLFPVSNPSDRIFRCSRISLLADSACMIGSFNVLPAATTLRTSASLVICSLGKATRRQLLVLTQ